MRGSSRCVTNAPAGSTTIQARSRSKPVSISSASVDRDAGARLHRIDVDRFERHVEVAHDVALRAARRLRPRERRLSPRALPTIAAMQRLRRAGARRRHRRAEPGARAGPPRPLGRAARRRGAGRGATTSAPTRSTPPRSRCCAASRSGTRCRADAATRGPRHASFEGDAPARRSSSRPGSSASASSPWITDAARARARARRARCASRRT